MKNLFAPYELGKLAKEKGFNDPCIAFYNVDTKIPVLASAYKTYDERYPNQVLAPTHQQILDWLRDKHKVDVTISRY